MSAVKPEDDGIVQIAKTCHEANRVYCAALGDDSQLVWDEAPEWQRESAIDGVNFHLANPDANPGQSHNNWMTYKWADGWRYGEVKDAEAKVHPCIVPFLELPVAQQFKDILFIAVVRSFI